MKSNPIVILMCFKKEKKILFLSNLPIPTGGVGRRF